MCLVAAICLPGSLLLLRHHRVVSAAEQVPVEYLFLLPNKYLWNT